MADYRLLEAHREAALAETRHMADRLRRAADRLDAYANRAQPSTDNEAFFGKLAADVLNELTGTIGNLNLGKLAQDSADWAKVAASRQGS